MTTEGGGEALLATLAAERAIRRLLSAYGDAVSRRDPEAVQRLFAPDCRVKIADFPERVGLESFMDGLRRTFATFSFLHQRSDAGLIDVSGITARGRISVFEANQRKDAAELSLMFGAYEDDYVLLPEGWRFKTRKFTLKYLATVPVSSVTNCPELKPAFGMLP